MADRTVSIKIQIEGDGAVRTLKATEDEVQKLRRSLKSAEGEADDFGDEAAAAADKTEDATREIPPAFADAEGAVRDFKAGGVRSLRQLDEALERVDRAMREATDAEARQRWARLGGEIRDVRDSTEQAAQEADQMGANTSLAGGLRQDAGALSSGLKSGNFQKAAGAASRLGAALAPAAAGAYAVGRALAFVGGKAISFEKALTGVGKTTGLAGDELDALGEDLQDLAGRLGAPQDELAAIAETAGQLGITGSANITAFTETTAKLAAVTELTAEEAASQIAKISNAFNLPITEAENLGSVLNGLSNTTTAKAGDISQALTRVGNSASAIGLTADEVAALGATLIDSGVEAETAGTSLRNVFIRMQSQSAELASQIGMTSEEFSSMVQDDALGALRAYLDGLRQMPKAQRAIKIKEIFGDENFLAVQSLAQQVDGLNTNLERAGELNREGASLNTEFARTLETVSKQWAKLKGHLLDVATTIGSAALPGVQGLLEAINGLFEGTEALAEETKRLRAEQEDLAGVEEAISTYQDLADQTGLSEEKQRDLNEAVETLKKRFPGYVTETENAAGTVRIYADAAKAAYEQQKLLNREQLRSNVEGLTKVFEQGRGSVKRTRDDLAELRAELKELNRLKEQGRSTVRRIVQGRRGEQAFRDVNIDNLRNAISGQISTLVARVRDGKSKVRTATQAMVAPFVSSEGLDVGALADQINSSLDSINYDEAEERARKLATRFYELGEAQLTPNIRVEYEDAGSYDRLIAQQREATENNERWMQNAAEGSERRMIFARQQAQAQANLNALLKRRNALNEQAPPPPEASGGGAPESTATIEGPVKQPEGGFVQPVGYQAEEPPPLPDPEPPPEDDAPTRAVAPDPEGLAKSNAALATMETRLKEIKTFQQHGLIEEPEADEQRVQAITRALKDELSIAAQGVDGASEKVAVLKKRLAKAQEQAKGDWGAQQMQQLASTARQATQVIGQLFRAQHQQRMQEIRTEKQERIRGINAREKQELAAIDRQIEAAAKGTARRAQLQKKRATMRQNYDDKREKAQQQFQHEQAEAKRKQARMDREQALFEIALNTAVGVSKVWGQTGIFGLAAEIPVLAMGAAQTAVVASKPLPEVPEFAEGVTGFSGGAAIVGERGPEMVTMGRGANVLTNENTTRIIEQDKQNDTGDTQQEIDVLRKQGAKTRDRLSSASGVDSFAQGAVGLTREGVITGPGGPTDDVVPAKMEATPIRVSAGESIVTAAATDAAPRALAAMNADPAFAAQVEHQLTRPAPELRRYAEGAVRVKRAGRLARRQQQAAERFDDSALLDELRKSRAETKRQTERIEEQTERLEAVERNIGIDQVDEELERHRSKTRYRR